MSMVASGVVHVSVAFLAMCAWAVFANRHHPMPAPLVAGLVQGAISASITFALKRVVEAVSARTRGVTALILPTFAAWTVSFVVLVVIHRLAGTPELWATIAIPNLVATTYAAIYAAAIRRPA